MKRNAIIQPIVFAAFLIVVMFGTASAQTLSDYSALPPFLGPEIPPNILLLVDNSGSMNHCAYSDTGVDGCLALSGANLSTGYVSTTQYFGYYQEDKCYTYATNTFSPQGNRPCTNEWDGNFLNWLSMRRIDITKWVMTGGLCNSVRASANSCTKIKGQSQFSNGACCKAFYKQFDLTNVAPATFSGLRCVRVEGGNFYILGDGTCSSNGGTMRRITVDGVIKQTGVIQEVGDRARFGLMTFDDDGGNDNGAEIRSDLGDNMVSMINAIEGLVATSWTPLAESLYEASRYFAQITPAYENTDFKIGPAYDPYCLENLSPPAGETGCKTATNGRWAPCCQGFVLMFTDGDPTKDQDIPAAIQDYAHTAAGHGSSTHCAAASGCLFTHLHASHPNNHPAGLSHNTMSEHHDPCSAYYGGISGGSCLAEGSHFLDDVAFWAHTTDLRPPSGTNIAGINEPGYTPGPNNDGLPGMQNITFYPFFAFGTGSQLLKDAAKVGGFEDKNKDGLPGPDPKEWDKDGDGVPDTYFESQNAYTLKTRLIAAISAILQRSASGTSVSVLATSTGGEGAVYQAYFFPSIDEGQGEAAWLGYMQGLFFDEFGQLREDTPPQDGRLDLKHDKIVETFFDMQLLETKVRRYDLDASGNKTTYSVIDLDEMKPIWEGGKVLANRNLSTDPRLIKTWVDGNANGTVDSGEFIDFSAANEATLRPYLRAANATEGKNIIDFIHGEQISGYRKREIDVDGTTKTWRLGDIVYSSPVSVGPPAEGYDTKYGDDSFTLFYSKYKERRQVVYVGGNDGMLHAFNAGFFHEGDDPNTNGVEEHGYFTTAPNANTVGATPLGEELWAFIPQELLPHLKWLTGTDYDKGQHVYMVDGSPRIASLQIFTEQGDCSNPANASCKYPGGWGTVLIGSLRMGGGLIKVDLNGDGDTTDPGEDRFRSAYFALDITDPEAGPDLLWVYSDADLGFTTSWPAVTRYDKDTWYGVFGSGPLSYDGLREASATENKFESTATEVGQIYTINLKDGTLVDKRSAGTEVKAFMGDPVVYDMPQNYVTDATYIGKNYSTAGGWSGKVYRLLSYGNKNPASWVLSEFFDPQKPVTVKPTASMDTSGRFWIYFGTGRFYSAGPTSDQTDTSQQALYGVKESHPKGCWDSGVRNWKASCTNTIPLSSLLNVTDIDVKKDGTITCSACGATTVKDLITNVIHSSSGSSSEKGGWVIDLFNGERVVHESSIIGGIVAVTTYTPGQDICIPQGTNAVYALMFEAGIASIATDKAGNVVGALGFKSDGVTAVRNKDLGQGVASKVNVVVSDNTITGFVQSSTGEIVQIKDVSVSKPIRQGTRVFTEKPE